MSATIAHEAATGSPLQSANTGNYTITATVRGKLDKPDWALCLTGKQQDWAHTLQGHYDWQSADMKYFVQRTAARSMFATVWDLMAQLDKRRVNKDLLELLRKLVVGTATVSDLVPFANQVNQVATGALHLPIPSHTHWTERSTEVGHGADLRGLGDFRDFRVSRTYEGLISGFNSGELTAWLLQDCRGSVLE